MSQETLELVDILQNAIEARLVDLHTSIPATVLKFYPATNTVDVQPSLKRKYQDGTVKPLPSIKGVPIMYPRGGGAILSFPLEVGNPVTLFFSERSLDVWKSKGGTVDPQEGRKFNLSDAYCYPGGSSYNQASDRVSKTATRLEFGQASIELQKDGKFKISSIGGEELFSLLSDLADECSKIANSMGPTFNAAAFVALKAKLDELKGE